MRTRRMTPRMRAGLSMGCAAALLLAAGSSGALQPQPTAPAGAASAPPSSPAGAASAPPPPGYPPPGYPPPPVYRWNPGPWYGPPPGQEPEKEKKPERIWYGWQHLIVLGASSAMVPLATEVEPLAYLSFAGFTLGGPIVHWANGRIGRGFGSLGLNAGCTLVGGLIGAGIWANEGDYGGVYGFIIGGGVGLLTANIIDIAALEYKEVEPQGYDYNARRRPPHLRVVPQVAVAPGRASFGLGGTF